MINRPTHCSAKGLINGLFQLEASPGMYRVVTQLRPDNFEEFSAIPALYRPGPLESGFMQQFINRKNGLQKVEYIHESLKGRTRKYLRASVSIRNR